MTIARTTDVETLLATFDYRHLDHGQERDVVVRFARLADQLVDALPDSPDVREGLQARSAARTLFSRIALDAA